MAHPARGTRRAASIGTVENSWWAWPGIGQRQSVSAGNQHAQSAFALVLPDSLQLAGRGRPYRDVEDSLAGKDNEAIRGVANKVIELAHRVRHSTAPTRREAGIAADSVIMLANILRRVDQDF